MTTAAIYVRISKDKTGEEWGVREQEVACRRLAEQRGVTVHKVYVENDLSAMKDRPVFDQMIAEVGQVDAIIVKHVDRLYRRVAQLEGIIPSLQDTPVHAVLSGNIDLSTADGRLHARMMGAVAQHEIEKAAERMRDRRQQKIAAGLWMGKVPRGYTRTSGVMSVDPVEGPKVAEAVQRVLSGGSIHGIAREWGVRHTSVRRLLQSPALAGLTSAHQPGQWDALVPEADWWRLQALLGDRQRADKYAPRTESLTLLGGILRCSHGSTMRRMKTRYRADCPKCHIHVSGPKVDEHVTAWILDRLGSPEAAAAFRAPEETTDFKRIEALKARRKTLASLIADELLDEADARQQLTEIKDELARLETSARPSLVLPNTDPAVVSEVWDEMTVQEKRQVVRLLCSVTILPAGKGNVARTDFSRIEITPAVV